MVTGLALRVRRWAEEMGMTLQELLAFALAQGASDLHLSSGLPPLLRIDGEVCKLSAPPLDDAGVRALLDRVLTAPQRKTFEAAGECDFAFAAEGLARFRVNVFRQNRGAAAVFRVIPDTVSSLAGLGLGPLLEHVASLRRGLILVTGPTGSGKSTTLAAMIDHLNRTESQHILTIEDPIEFVHEPRQCLINQREVHRDTESFACALRAALREDPDVILVGELRDLETIRLALEAAETGHVVFATLHTQSAAKTIDRLIDVFPGAEKAMVRTLLSESLQAVISQTLLKKQGGGRVAAQEIMLCTPAIRNLIREDKVAQMYSAIQTGAEHGMVTLDQALEKLVRAGTVDAKVAQRYARFPETFQDPVARR